MRLRATCALGVLCCATFIAHPSTAAYALHPGAAEPLSFGTSLFLHQDWTHLLSNMAGLALFGADYETRQGSLRMIGVFVAGGLLGSVAEYLADPNYAGAIIGASGAIAAVIGACATSRWRLFSVLPLFALFAWNVLVGGSDGAADVAHLAGMVVGLAVAVSTRVKEREDAKSRDDARAVSC